MASGGLFISGEDQSPLVFDLDPAEDTVEAVGDSDTDDAGTLAPAEKADISVCASTVLVSIASLLICNNNKFAMLMEETSH